jgi:U3 small nucleolar RNA-associated protein 10
MNSEAVLRVFLPYHESPNFPRILSILVIPTSSPYYAPFSSLIKKAQPIPRSYITTVISPARDRSLHLLGDIAGLVKQAVEEKVVHRALLAFWTSVMVDLLEKTKIASSVPESVVKLLVETFVTVLSIPDAGSDVNVRLSLIRACSP